MADDKKRRTPRYVTPMEDMLAMKDIIKVLLLSIVWFTPKKKRITHAPACCPHHACAGCSEGGQVLAGAARRGLHWKIYLAHWPILRRGGRRRRRYDASRARASPNLLLQLTTAPGRERWRLTLQPHQSDCAAGEAPAAESAARAGDQPNGAAEATLLISLQLTSFLFT